MIDPHKRLSEAFDTLPEIQGMNANYKWGDDMHLNQLLKIYNDKNQSLYPLIYNISNKTTQHKNILEYDSLKLIIATRNTNTDWHNGNRWATSYEKVLFPMVKNIIRLFTSGSIFIWDGKYDVLEFPNYGESNKNKTTDIWDALRLDTKIKIYNEQVCLKTIIY